MATFAPETPVQPEYPYFWSKPTQEPKPDISGELRGKAIEEGLKGGASAIRDGAQGITAAYEKGIQNTIYAGVDPLRDQYMDRLHSADQSLQGRDTPDPLGRDAPRDVKGLPNTLNTLDSARANGKLSQTDYDARLNALAKEVRSKYPGYRQYVDEEFKRITGRDSANQYIRSVIQDVDSFVSARKGEGDKLANKILASGFKYKEGNFWYQKLQENPDKYGPQALSWLNSMEAKDHDLEMAEKQISFLKSTDSLNRERETDIQNKAINDSSAHFWSSKLDTIATHLNIDPKTNDRMQDILNQIRRGDYARDVTPQEATQLRTFLQQQRAALSSERAADLSHSFPNMKSEDISKTVEAELKTQFDPYMEALGKGDFSTAELLKNTIKAKNLQAGSVAYSDPKWGQAMSFISGLREIDPQLANQFDLQFSGQATPELSGEYAKATAAAASPAEQGGKAHAEIIQDLNAKNAGKDGKLQKSIIETYATIGAKGPNAISDESADRLIESAFGPKSSDVLKYFAQDQQYTGRGASFKTLGKQWMFNTFTSDNMIARIAKRGKEKPELYEHFKNWSASNSQYLLHDFTQAPPAEEERGRDRLNFKGLVPGLIGQQRGAAPPEGLTAQYDTDNNTFSFRYNGKLVNRPDLNNLSSNMHRLSEIAKHDPSGKGDPRLSVYGVLKEARGEDGSIVDHMLKAMETSHQ